jgi:hypothetical protein
MKNLTIVVGPGGIALTGNRKDVLQRIEANAYSFRPAAHDVERFVLRRRPECEYDEGARELFLTRAELLSNAYLEFVEGGVA